MNKVSSADLLKQASVMLRNLAKERDELAVKVAQLSEKLGEYEHNERVLQVAEKLASRGPYAGLPLQERVNFVRAKLAEGMSLNDLDQAIGLLTPDGSIGTVNDKTASGLEGFLEQLFG